MGVADPGAGGHGPPPPHTVGTAGPGPRQQGRGDLDAGPIRQTKGQAGDRKEHQFGDRGWLVCSLLHDDNND